jgi:lysophospholipase L1-like esterase
MSLTNMGCWGETTASFISGGCIGPDNGVPTKVTYANGNQLDTAKAFLQANGNSVKLVTLDIGINDIAYNCFDFNTGELDYACVSQTLPVIHDNLVTILTALQSVSSSSTKFIIGNTFDPFQNVLPSTILAVQELNQVYDQVAGETHISLADIASTVHFNDYPNGGNPYLCGGSAPLSWVCINGDTHSTTLGYTLIANTFYDTYENI